MTWTVSRHTRDSHDPFTDWFEGWGQLHDHWFPGFRSSRGEPQLPLNVFENADGVVIRAEVPGVAPESIDLSVENDTLTLTVDRPEPETVEGTRYHRRERAAGKVSRSVRLPWRIDADNVSATYRHGILEVRLVRVPEDRPRKIEVKSS